MTCECECVSKVFLILLNTLTGLFGFVLLAVGIFVQFAGNLLGQWLNVATKELGMAEVDIAKMYEDVRPIVNIIAIPLIVIGAFFFIVSMFGCYGACCKNRLCLLIYAFMVTIVFVGLLAGVIYIIAGGKEIKEKAKSKVKKEIVDNFVGVNSTNGISLVVNIVQIYFECCGMDNSTDFDKCKKWERDVSYDIQGVKINGTLQIPITCCKMNGTFPNVKPKNQFCPTTSVDSNKNTGCFKKLEEFATQYTTYMYVVLALPLVLLAILMGLGWYLWKKAGDSDLGSVAKMV